MGYQEDDHENILALKNTLLNQSYKKNIFSTSFVGNDRELKKKWGDDISAYDINNKIQNLQYYPHIFVLACLMDRQMSAEKAWSIPYIICKKLCNGKFDFNSLHQLEDTTITNYFVDNKLHRFPVKAAEVFISAINRIATCYDGDASKIWTTLSLGNMLPGSSEVIYRFLQFKGCGVKIATMAANVLHRDLNIQNSECYSLDISPDSMLKEYCIV